MDASTVARLNALNREFYARHAEAFDEKRRAPWPGWKRIRTLPQRSDRLTILDVGCGNGRFGLFLSRETGRRLDYVGVDSSRRLLEIAAARCDPSWRWIEAEVVESGLPSDLVERFDLVACFGVMHHIPGETRRRALLESMAQRVRAGGRLAVSFWRFGAEARFVERALDWRSFGFDPAELEEGDYLLPWGQRSPGPSPARYCHYVNRSEAQRLIEGVGLAVADEFLSDGRTGDLNRYVVLRAAG